MPQTPIRRLTRPLALTLSGLCMLAPSSGCTRKAQEATEGQIQPAIGQWYVDPELQDVTTDQSATVEVAHPLLQTVYLGIFEDKRFQRHMIDHQGKLLSCEGAWRVRLRDGELLLFETECRGETAIGEEINLGLNERIDILDADHIQVIDRASGTRRSFERSKTNPPEHLEANWLLDEITPRDSSSEGAGMVVLANNFGLQPMFRFLPDRSLIIQSPRVTRRGAWQVVEPRIEDAIVTVNLLLEQDGALSFQQMNVIQLEDSSLEMVDGEGNHLALSAVVDPPEPTGVELGTDPTPSETEGEHEGEEAHEHDHNHHHDH